MKKFVDKISEKFYVFCTEKLHLKISEAKWAWIVQFIGFGIVGLSNTLISYVLYVGALYLLGRLGVSEKIDYLLAQAVSFILSVLWSFFWNNKLVFSVKDGESRNLWLALLKTYVSYSFTGLFLNSFLSWIWIDKLGMNKLIAPIINLVISVPLNFILNKLWAFRSKKKEDKAVETDSKETR